MAQSYGVNFAKTRDANGAALPAWPLHDPGMDSIFEFRPDGSAGAGPDLRNARLDVMQLAIDSGRRADFCDRIVRAQTLPCSLRMPT